MFCQACHWGFRAQVTSGDATDPDVQMNNGQLGLQIYENV